MYNKNSLKECYPKLENRLKFLSEYITTRLNIYKEKNILGNSIMDQLILALSNSSDAKTYDECLTLVCTGFDVSVCIV